MIKVFVATHKRYRMPNDEMYLPLHVGASGKESIGFQRDDEGDNISYLNYAFCELTGLYWGWKNCDASYKGLAHYRRHFRGEKKTKDPFDCVLTQKEAEDYLKDTDILVTKKETIILKQSMITMSIRSIQNHWMRQERLLRESIRSTCSHLIII